MLEALATPVGVVIRYIHTGISHIPWLDSAGGLAWGLSIVLLTVTVRLLLFPLFVKQIKSQRRMQEIAPLVKDLQKKHKGDRESLNTELMKLYKDNNANPISGCLPLLLQLPVFFALFTVIREFKPRDDGAYGLTAQMLSEGGRAKIFGAPIAAAFNSPQSLLDQLGGTATNVRVVAAIMVVLMGASTFWTQRQMIARSGATDPQQVMVQKMLLYVLPLSFAVSGVFFPIGVLLYWLTTNVWSMGQQHWVIKRMPPVVNGAGKLIAPKSSPGTSGEPEPGKRPRSDPAPKSTSSEVLAAGEGPAAEATAPPAGARPAGSPTRPAAKAPPGRRAAGSRKHKKSRGGRR